MCRTNTVRVGVSEEQVCKLRLLQRKMQDRMELNEVQSACRKILTIIAHNVQKSSDQCVKNLNANKYVKHLSVQK